MYRIRVWDWPTRLFHWLLVAAVVGLVVSGNVGGAWMEWHMRLGFFVLSLLWFRLLWGLWGGRWSRFAAFLYAPQSLWAYLRGRSPVTHRVGHTPLGALSVFAMLAVLGLQVGTGLFTDDEIFYAGPLTALASYDTIEAASRYHKGWGKWILIGLVALHLLALLAYKLLARQALVSAMITGDKIMNEPAESANDGPRQWLLAAVLYAIACGLTYLVVTWGG
ncbi:cytochrome b/b6 domain-containing protein [Tepidicella xavieri]|uniref:Cytochrome b n=1 Tax=Tepidicella xavieri TaxID=360241 RepID=A0A4R6TZ83_9BURK|nr:cytochrome b/b6 domain-containing protein [Tepidicella xavieri]TDQ39298.1 cytochrome b [Tepidicella xavieri]